MSGQPRFDFMDDMDDIDEQDDGDGEGPPEGYEQFLVHLNYALKAHPALAYGLRRMNEANARAEADAIKPAPLTFDDGDDPEAMEERQTAPAALRFQRLRIHAHQEKVLRYLHEHPELAIEHGDRAVFAAAEQLGLFRHDE